MMKKLLFLIIILLVKTGSGFASNIDVTISGFTYVQSSTIGFIGDTVTIEASSMHPAVQISEATWDINGATPLPGGWGTNTSTFKFVINKGGDIFWSCANHHASGMKGRISVGTSIDTFTLLPANPTTADTISVIVSSFFTSSGCDLCSSTVIPSSNSILVQGFYGIGILTATCSRVDTFKIDPLPAGDYEIDFDQETGSLPCSGTFSFENFASTTIKVTTFVGINENNREHNFSVYPNPVNNKELHLDYLKGDLTEARVIILNLQGQVVKEFTGLAKQNVLDMDMASGLYFYQILNAGKQIQNGKIVVQ
jgi:hypothetical protein